MSSSSLPLSHCPGYLHFSPILAPALPLSHLPRWYDINNYDVRKIVEDYSSRAIPLDLFILDMDWHTKNDWTGYTFDARLFPYPADTLAWLKQKGASLVCVLCASCVGCKEGGDVNCPNFWKIFPSLRFKIDWLLKTAGLHTAANIHDASGVNNWENMYAAMALSMGKDPSKVQCCLLRLCFLILVQDSCLSLYGWRFSSRLTPRRATALTSSR